MGVGTGSIPLDPEADTLESLDVVLTLEEF